MSKRKRHPIQPVICDKDRIPRFKCNKIVRFLCDTSSFDLNKLTHMEFPKEDWEQFAQLIGYSVEGAAELSYMSKHIIREAYRMSDALVTTKKQK